jgi:hypothetical protein
MRRSAPLTFLAMPILLVGCGYQMSDRPPQRSAAASVSPSATASATPSAEPGVFTSRCSTGQLTVGLQGGGFSEPTGQHTVPLVINNISTNGCFLFGYPQVAFIDGAGHTIPFQYQTTGDQVVTAAAPRHVDLVPHGLAYVTLNKYRCDLGDVMETSRVRLTPPGESASLDVAITDMPYCGPGDPGSVVHVSPIAATQLATLSH